MIKGAVMPFTPGSARPPGAGRKSGTPNKRTNELIEILAEYEVEPVKAMLDLLPQLTAKEQVDVFRDLLPYLYPKRKALEIDGDMRVQAMTPNWTAEELTEMIRAARGAQINSVEKPAALSVIEDAEEDDLVVKLDLQSVPSK
jgi:hypothetical protein